MISVAIFTLNEEVNLPFCLRSLGNCDDVVLVDSFSTDRTCEIAKAHGCRVYRNTFEGFGTQRNWAFQNIPFQHPWVLILDADERVTPSLWKEMMETVSRDGVQARVGAFRLKRRFYWEGVPLTYANLYPSWIVRLVRLGWVKYINRGHAETQQVEGEIGSLQEDLVDENHKGLEEWRGRQRKYAEEDARYEATLASSPCLSEFWATDPLRRRAAWKYLASHLPARGLVYFLYSYVWRSGWRDGEMGFRFCFEKALFRAHAARMARRFRANLR